MADAAAAPASINEQEFGSTWRELSGPLTGVLFLLSAAFAAFHLLNLNYLALDSILFRIVHLCGGAALAFALVRSSARDKSGRIPWYDWLLIAACIGVALNFVLDFSAWQMRAGATYTTRDVVAALLGTFIVLEFVRRTAGWALTIIALVFIVYGFVGPWMPGSLFHKGFDFGFWFTSLFAETGVFGQTLEVSSTFIIMFVVFAAFLSRSGAGDYFNDLSVALVGWARGGPAKVAVVSGVMFGSISGSSVANVVASGTITIPMMRRVGYDRATAAAIEATSSTGGQITPPVLGAGAFLMAEITATPYAQIAYMAVIPCLLFYVANYAHCHLHALRHGLKGIPRAELPRIRPMLLKIYFVAPIFFLIYAFITGFSAFRAAALGMIAAILVTLHQIARGKAGRDPWRAALLGVVLILALALLVSLLEDDLPAIARGLGFGGLAVDIAAALKAYGGKQLFFALALSSIALGLAVGWFVRREASPLALRPGATAFGIPGLAKALDSGTRDSLQLIACCAAAGIVAGAIASTGIGQRLAYVMQAIAGNDKLVALLFSAVIVTILGMGMPTTAAYAIAASVVAPGLTQIGIDKLVAHMFIFYYAVMSAITPPVAVASFAAAAMAKADPWRTSWIACRNGLAAFIVPFLFFYSPVLLGRGDWQSVAAALASAIVGVYFLACATEGWLNGPLATPVRVLLGIAAIGMMLPELYSTLAGLAIGLGIFAAQRRWHGADPASRVPAPPQQTAASGAN